MLLRIPQSLKILHPFVPQKIHVPRAHTFTASWILFFHGYALCSVLFLSDKWHKRFQPCFAISYQQRVHEANTTLKSENNACLLVQSRPVCRHCQVANEGYYQESLASSPFIFLWISELRKHKNHSHTIGWCSQTISQKGLRNHASWY